MVAPVPTGSGGPAGSLHGLLARLRDRNEWKFFATLPRADRRLAGLWWLVVVARGLLPALFAVAMGSLVGAVEGGAGLAGPLAFAGVVFVLLQVLAPLHQALGANLGDRTAAWLYDRLTAACSRPPGLAHLEDPSLTGDLTVARDFDRGVTGPPLYISMDFLAGGLVDLLAGLACAVLLAGYGWWAPLVLAGGWLATHWLLRESAVWRDRATDAVRRAQREADYAYRLAVDPPASKELRLFGLASWTLSRFVASRTRLHELQYAATRLRERPVLLSVLLVSGANVAVCWSLAGDAAAGSRRPRGRRGLCPGGGGHRADRVRGAQLGHRRMRGAGGGGAAARGRNGAERCPGGGQAARRCSPPARDPVS